MLTDQQLKVYDNLFQISEKNMVDSGNDMQIMKDAFLSVVGEPALRADIIRIYKLSKKAFLQALYALALRRIPEESMLKSCDNDSLTDNEYKQKITESVRHSIEFRDKQARIYNNCFSTHKNIPTITTYFAEYPVLNKIYGVYRRLPQKFRKKVRKVFGRKE